MKTEETIIDARIHRVTINPELDKIRTETLFPEKLAKANEMLKNAKLPPNKNIGKQMPEPLDENVQGLQV